MSKNSDMQKQISELVEQSRKKEITPQSAYTKIAKEVFKKVRAGEMKSPEADEILINFAQELGISGKVAFKGTSAMM